MLTYLGGDTLVLMLHMICFPSGTQELLPVVLAALPVVPDQPLPEELFVLVQLCLHLWLQFQVQHICLT